MAFVKSGLPCPKCDSSDAYAIDSRGWGKCFSCYVNIPNASEDFEATEKVVERRVASPAPVQARTEAYSGSQSISVGGISDRKVSDKAAQQYGVGYDGDDLVFPYGESAAKIRKKGQKNFTIKGDWKGYKGLFGQDKFAADGKKLILCEGEIDALSIYQMLEYRYPVCSLRSGAQSAAKDCKDNYEFIDSFDEVFVCFDMDEPGKAAASQVAELFAKKARIVKLPNGMKDANEMLMADQTKEFGIALWRAEAFVPDGIVSGEALYEAVMEPIQGSDCDYPFDGMNELTYGIRKGELVTVTAGSGLGKSQFLREIIYNIIQNTDEKVGLMFMEESVRKTGLSLMSLAANKPLHLPDSKASQEEKDNAYAGTLGTGRVYLFDHFGSSDVDNIVSRVRYMAKAMDCHYVFLDHISIVVSAQSNGDERKANK